MNRVAEPTWHTLPADAVLSHLHSSWDGLDDKEVARRLKQHGRNILPGAPQPSLVMIFIHQLANPLIYILIGAGIMSLVIGDVEDALFIFLVILINAVIGTYQEWKAEQSARALQNLLKVTAHVRRNGQEMRVSAEELVPGDVVLVESGDRVPADIRLERVRNLAVDESILTGESLPVEKEAQWEAEAGAPVSDRRNMLFAGATVTSGRGLGVVVATGLHTEVGKIARSVSETATTKTPLVHRMEVFSRNIGLLFLGACFVLGITAISKGYPFQDVMFMVVALAVSAIPEGLPVAMTVALSVGTQRMAKRNVIVRKLMAVEGLGSCTCIASDKTGTLTLNRQTVKRLFLLPDRYLEVTGEGYNGEGEVITPDGNIPPQDAMGPLRQLARAAMLCNEGMLIRDAGEWRHEGDPMDIALLALGYKLGFDAMAVRHEMPQVGEIPYESERRYAAQFYLENGRVLVALKGAVEVILPRCDRQLTANGEEPLDTDTVTQVSEDLSRRGYRLLAIAQGQMSSEMDFAEVKETDLPPLLFLGLAGFIDPLRPEAPGAIKASQRAGVRVIMITGDHPATALAISRQLGIAREAWDVTSGPELAALGSPDNPAFLDRINQVSVFARVTPVQKLNIVDGLIRSGHFVAVTGDGVNDTPALRMANIGVAMGSGSDIAKDTAKIIITDDNFASIEAGIEEGRYAYDNVRKVVFLLLSTGAAEGLLVTLSLLFTLPIPLRPAQLLWLNLVTNSIQHVGLAFEAGEKETMERPPRNPKEGIFDRMMIHQNIVAGLAMGGTAFVAWFWLLGQGWEETAARNLLLLLMVLLENFHAFNCRSELKSVFRVPLRKNMLLVFGVLAAQGVHILAMHLPVLQRILQVQPVSLLEWSLLLLWASIILITMEIFKAFKRRYGGISPPTIFGRKGS